jgi:general secretion pathway protein A
MYERFYRLRERPFALTPDPDYLYPSRGHQEALGYLRYGIETQAGFVVVTGAIGSGKTTLLQTLFRGLDSHTTVARVMNTLLDPRELLESAMIDLGLDASNKSKPQILKQFGEFLVQERMAGRSVLLVIDEAQNLTLPALEEIRMLSNLETEKSKLLQIILMGQPDLRDKLDRPELEQLRQRITVSYHLEPLDADETAQYVNHRLARASIGTPMVFSHEVTARIHTRSGGVPRLINVIADAALVFGYGEEQSEIDVTLLDIVIDDLDSTGVLGPRSDASRHAHASVVPADPVAAAALLQRKAARSTVAAEPGRMPAPTGDTDQLTATLEQRERQLRQRELDVAARERELLEQRRVLAEQYRLLRSQPQSTPGVASAAAAWPPPAHGHAAGVKPASPRFESFPTRRPGLWRRMRHTLLGDEAVLEDSL